LNVRAMSTSWLGQFAGSIVGWLKDHLSLHKLMLAVFVVAGIALFLPAPSADSMDIGSFVRTHRAAEWLTFSLLGVYFILCVLDWLRHCLVRAFGPAYSLVRRWVHPPSLTTTPASGLDGNILLTHSGAPAT